MRIAVAQIGSGENKEMNRYMIERLAWSASEAGADMLFLPEYAMFCAGNDRAAALGCGVPMLCSIRPRGLSGVPI